MKKKIIVGFLVVSVAISASGQRSGMMSPYSQYGLGTLADQSQSAIRGMGGTGIGLRDGKLVNTLNPASYSAVDSLTMLFDVGLSGQITNFKENGNSVNARSADFDYAVGLFRVRKNVGVSFGVLPYSDIGYSYTSSVALNNTIGNLTETYTGSGGLNQGFLGVGWRPIKPLSVGVNLAYLWGDYTRSVSTTGSSVNSLSKTYSANISSYNVTFGAQWQQPFGKKDVMTLGATLGLGHKLGADPTCDIINTNTSTQVSDTTSFIIKNGLELPVTFGAGLAWNHDQKLTVAADFTLQKWGSVDFPSYNEATSQYTLRSNLLQDRKRMSLGLDYVPDANHLRNYLKRVHYRLGAAYATPYYKVNGQDGPKEFSLSAGLGLPLLSKWNLQVAMRPVLNISAQWVHTSAKDLITDNTFRVTLGLTFNERWFAKWRVD